jgi:RsiW-degrading membrane proteinase PrsW (M82 family)
MLIFIINSIAVYIWIRILLHYDINTKDKKSLKTFFQFFFGGILSMIPTAILYSIFPTIDDTFDKTLSTLIINNILIVGSIEEISKFILFVFLCNKLHSIKEPRDGILLAASVGIGFAFYENFYYAQTYGLIILIVRAIVCISGHMLNCAIWGVSYAHIIYDKKRFRDKADYIHVTASIIVSAVLHGLYNLFLDYYGGVGFIFAINLQIIMLLLVRKKYREIIKDTPYKRFPYSEYKKAITIIKKALDHNPGSLVLNCRIARYYIYSGEYAKAKSHLEKCLTVNPKNSYLKALKGIASIMTGVEGLTGIEGGKNILGMSYPMLRPAIKKFLKKEVSILIRDKKSRGEIISLMRG